MPMEADNLAARLTRIKHLIEELDSVTGRTAQQQAAFLNLKKEIAAMRDSLKILQT
jgi:hypothetical protein